MHSGHSCKQYSEIQTQTWPHNAFPQTPDNSQLLTHSHSCICLSTKTIIVNIKLALHWPKMYIVVLLCLERICLDIVYLTKNSDLTDLKVQNLKVPMDLLHQSVVLIWLPHLRSNSSKVLLSLSLTPTPKSDCTLLASYLRNGEFCSSPTTKIALCCLSPTSFSSVLICLPPFLVVALNNHLS